MSDMFGHPMMGGLMMGGPMMGGPMMGGPTLGDPIMDELSPFFTQPGFWAQWVSCLPPEKLLEVGHIIILGSGHDPMIVHSMWSAVARMRWEQQQALESWQGEAWQEEEEGEQEEEAEEELEEEGNQEWGNDQDGWSLEHPLMDEIVLTVGKLQRLIQQIQEDLSISVLMDMPGGIHEIFTQVTCTNLKDNMQILEEILTMLQEGETVEKKAAQFLQTADDMMRASRHPSLLGLQRLAGDLVLLLCSRPVNLQLLREKKDMPQLLIDKMSNALGRDLGEDEMSNVRLRKCKYHVFNEGRKWGKRKAKLGRRERNLRNLRKQALLRQQEDETQGAASTRAEDYTEAAQSGEQEAGQSEQQEEQKEELLEDLAEEKEEVEQEEQEEQDLAEEQKEQEQAEEQVEQKQAEEQVEQKQAEEQNEQKQAEARPRWADMDE